MNFKLNKDGDGISLYDPRGTLVDSVVFGVQGNNVSQGRWPDGNASVYFMRTPTAAAPNVIFNPPAVNVVGLTVLANGATQISWFAIFGTWSDSRRIEAEHRGGSASQCGLMRRS